MKIKSEEAEILNRVKKIASDLGDRSLIVSRPKRAGSFLIGLKEKISDTRHVYRKIVRRVKDLKHLTREIENIFDNYYIIDSTISDVLNAKIGKNLKKVIQVEETPGSFVPRIYLILSELLKATEYTIDRDILHSFLRAYQAKTHLSIRELGLVAFFLKTILVENIRNEMLISIEALNVYNEADRWYKQITKSNGGRGDRKYLKITSDLALKYGVIPANLGFNLLQKLSQFGPDTRPITKWLKLNLLKQGISISDLAKMEDERQSLVLQRVSNIKKSLFWIDQARWDNFVTEVNIIDSLLSKDPSGVYNLLDQTSQDIYKDEVVKISDRVGIYESEVVKLALRLCRPSGTAQPMADIRTNHIGYYLVGAGRSEMEKKIGYQKHFFEKLRLFVLNHAFPFYLGSIFLINVILTASLVRFLPVISSMNTLSWLIGLLIFVLNCDIAINLINLIVSSLIPVRALFRLDLSAGISEDQSTFVVIPSMFRDKKASEDLLRRLEVNYLGNSQSNMFFALLLGFKNSASEIEGGDEALITQIRQGIVALNRKYPAAVDRFYLFHRRRIWNPQENVFMEWERKRGKLREFNSFLRGNTKTSFVEELPECLPHIRYVITIDEDTRLPRDSAVKLIGCIDHPLNRPVVDKSTGQVIGGYGIIQPRMTVKFNQARQTVFSRLFSSAAGIDSYSGPVADVYQDLFNDSIFYGKGIYDVDTMEAVIGDRIPENQVLSHDLLEGLYLRVGFATDIVLFENFPESYKEYILRMHRWIRGDWQIIRWLKNGGTKGNQFLLSGKWKIIDNLRRSLLPFLSVLFLFLSYLSWPNFYPQSLVYILLVVGSPFLISYFLRIFNWPKDMTVLMKLNTILDNLDSVLWQIIYRFIFLFDQAIISVRAITISAFRMFISHRNMLSWQISHEVSKKARGTLREFIYLMWPAQAVSLILLVLLYNSRHGFYFYITMILWSISPFVAYQISQKEKKDKLKLADTRLLRQIAYRSAKFFFDMSSKNGNHLIPDHYQEEPVTYSPATTSPTNIGMHLLSYLSAYDFGYISFSDFCNQVLKLVNTLKSLEKFNGHFLNWYDIHTLESLNPKYVSSADSANLLANFIVLKQGILDAVKKPLVRNNFAGLFDILAVLADDCQAVLNDRTISKSERRLSRQLSLETKRLLGAYVVYKGDDTIETAIKTLNDLAGSNEKIKKIISHLNLSSKQDILLGIFSSAEHFNFLLGQYFGELDGLMSFYYLRKNRPAIHNEKENLPLAEALSRLFMKMNNIPSLEYLCGPFRREVESLDLLKFVCSANLSGEEKEKLELWYHQVCAILAQVETKAHKIKTDSDSIISALDKFFDETNFSFLYNRERGLFHIGYNVTYNKIDNSYYDLLASEANLISFLAILKGEVPIKHWFYLGRKLVRLNMNQVLLSSWGGSLFEYLTSLIFFKVHSGSLLGRTAKLAIEGHIKYGCKHQIPWGMGESAYSVLDLKNNYQYQIFGHPDLGFRRDLKDFLVIAPYTTLLSLAFKPKAALANIKRLIKYRFYGQYGFYDAVDYTSGLDNFLPGKSGFPVKIYYAHHQGFSLQSLNNQLNDGRISSLFMSDPRVESLDTLFEENMPSSVPARPIKGLKRLQVESFASNDGSPEVKKFIPLSSSYPRQAFLSNGSYTVNISNTGSGGSMVSNLCLTRFHEDAVAEPWGQFIYIYDAKKGNLWSATTQPVGIAQGKNKIEFFENKACFSRLYNEVESLLTVAVAPDSNVEFRTLNLTNHSKEKKSLSIASYGEVSLSRLDEDLQHPAFEKLFIKAEFWPKHNALVYTRPDKVKRDSSLYFAHKIVSSSEKLESIHLMDRSRFVSRGGSLSAPNLFNLYGDKVRPTSGNNFDPIFCFDSRIELDPNETVTISYVNIFSHSTAELVSDLKRYDTQNIINHAIKKSDKRSFEMIGSLGLSSEQALDYQALASRLLSPHYSNQIKKMPEPVNEAGIQALWRLGLADNLPILIVRFYDSNDLPMIKSLLLCHKYLKYKGLAHDLVLLNEYPASYIKSFEDEIDFLLRYDQNSFSRGVQGGVLHLRSSHISPQDKENLISLARVLLDSRQGTIEHQISSLTQSKSRLPPVLLKPVKKIPPPGKDIVTSLLDLKFYNSIGGFSEAENEYVVNVNYKNGIITPCPWVNIIANKNIGFLITESGSMYTWLYDSYDNRLTKRIDDPLLDGSSEIFYLRDEETGESWNPTPLPVKSGYTFTVRHGLGYSQIKHKSHGLSQEMLVFVPPTDSIKIVRFKLRNETKTKKKLSLTMFLEMSVGGPCREYVKDYLKTERDEVTGALLTRNIFGESFKNCLSFADLNSGKNFITNDREEFLGKDGRAASPLAMRLERLSDAIYDDVDHCVAEQTFFEIDPGQEIKIFALLGGEHSTEEIQELVRKYRDPANCETSFSQIKSNWDDFLGKIKIKTPDDSLNLLFNSRLLYQLVSSRLLARTGYYQPSGAYGFRDQLQDAMALAWAKPEMTREIILKASRHQFEEGDAQNWWHDHNSFGVRSVFSDHQLWLPYVVGHYVEITADHEVLSEKEPYLKAPRLDFINNSSWAGVPEITKDKYDLYDHCLRAIEKTFAFGKNGLPLMGNGDWNDGLNKVGEKGIGESVWLGWFLYAVLDKFLPYMMERGDYDRAKRYELTAKNLKNSLERNSWDGKWYKRAFFDAGNSLGSHSNREFKIDSISQSWSVLSGAARLDRSKIAMNSVSKNLFQDDLLLLISPALKDSVLDPGYIRDYPPGVRENGSQYNHAALWAAQAFAKQKDSVNLMKIIDSVNPIKRSVSREKALQYKVEPYVVASDIYAKPSEAGRGGWTWYTGSAGVMYRTVLESLLGLRVRGDKMEINPCLPKDWDDTSITYTYGNSEYHIQIVNNKNVAKKTIKIDGLILVDDIVDLVDDGKSHQVRVDL